MDPRLGTWEDILKLKSSVRLMFDGMFNHIVALVSETNVPHEDNIQYFGNGHDEAQMVYNFALPPLVLHTFQTGSSAALTKWAMGLDHISDSATYFNILDSHDGIGVLGVKNILSDEEIEMMALRVNDAEAVLDEGQTRSISRRSFDRDTLYQTLDDPNTATHKIAYGFGDMILKRTREKAFHPNAPQRILNISDAVFTVLRTSVDQSERILCITNITPLEQRFTVDLSQLELNVESWVDILSGKSFRARGSAPTLTLSPYEVVWAKSNA